MRVSKSKYPDAGGHGLHVLVFPESEYCAPVTNGLISSNKWTSNASEGPLFLMNIL
jgi:hypothetical protein